MSIMEVSHRGKEFTSIIQKAESNLCELLSILANYEVLFLQGGSLTQLSCFPLNLCGVEDTTDYIVTRSWGDKAFKEGQRFCKANLAWSGKATKYTRMPSEEEIQLSPNVKYLHICANETIHGVEFKDYPMPKGDTTFLVANMLSKFCSKPVDVSKFGVIYVGAQKNVRPAGVTIAIIRNDLIGNAQQSTPLMLEIGRAHV